ncbi:uncharacterized protein isoform X4 [Leptinotarsa decemlineata]|uniref:uncharacterized protein isoform X4 n=1 Tax=Leptinotarsa decemlineata TaxID=7539 RepID=UPI003D30A6B2
MGQCMSRKAAGAFAASAAVSHNRPDKMQKRRQLRSPDDENNKPRRHHLSPQDTNKRFAVCTDQTTTTRGVATSFGFKRRPTTAPAVASNASAARRLAHAANNDGLDRNGNDAETDGLTANVAPTGRSTPRLVPPRKEPNATRVSRFGFRQTQSSRQNKVADLNCQADVVNQNRNNNALRKPIAISRPVVPTDNNNPRSKMMLKADPPPQQISRFTLQSTQLPRPEPIRVIETKTAKTLANNNRRVAGMNQQYVEETSSKDGSFTEDSGVGSHLSSCLGESDVIRGLNQFDASPTFGARRQIGQVKPRNLEVVVTAKNMFDVKDLDDSNDSCDSISAPPLPQLPSAFHSSGDNRNNSYPSTGLVRERTLEYQRLLDRDQRVRKVSKTSSEGFSDDYGEEEKTYRDTCRNEKTFVKPLSHPTFLKSRSNQLKCDSSPPSSDEQEWAHGGEAMADDVSFSLSSSDESKDKNHESSVPISTVVIGSAIQSLMSGSLSKSFTSSVSKEVKNVMLTIEDPKFAAVAAASNQASLLDDETLLSPADSISYSESEEIKRKLNRSSSNSKDINEKLTPPSPGTPTNASNSLSLSDGKEDFLIDDEIADQPALIFEDTLSMTQENNSETIMESTPKPKRKVPAGFEGSPLSSRRGKFLQNRTGSLDTLSPCESIASDDLMMDFYLSQSSGLDDCDGQSSGYPSISDTLIQKSESENACRGLRDWNSLLGRSSGQEKQKRSTPSRSRLLSARTSTPNSSSMADSPRSLESRLTRVGRPSATSSPVRHSRVSNLSSVAAAGYDSDDSIRLDRTNHKAIKQDIVSIKTMLLKLRRVLNETAEEELMRSETHNPFESHHLTNGIFNSLCLGDGDPSSPAMTSTEDNAAKARFEVAELRRQVLFLQGQLEDREKTVQSLQEQMIKLNNDNYHANLAPASTMSCDSQTCNAATQTERIRPISAGPSLLNGSSVDGSAGSLVSFRIGKVVFADFLFGVTILCAVNLLCILHLIYSCTC